MKKFISQEWKLRLMGHEHFDFVDVNVLSDQLLFIDPCLIEASQIDWCKKAHLIISSFFDQFYKAYKERDNRSKHSILEHANEINCTRLGYGQGDNGHGNTAFGLIDKFRGLEPLALEIDSMRAAEDLPVFIPGFDKDGLSDMITNILHRELNEFTLEQCGKWGKKANGTASFWTWDVEKSQWSYVKNDPCYIAPKGKLLLVPKDIVHHHYLCGTEHYFSRVILERMQAEEAFTDEKGKTKYPYKKDLETQII